MTSPPAVPPPPGPPPGWYPDPTDPRWLRHWDGVAWTEHVAPAQAPPFVPPPPSAGPPGPAAPGPELVDGEGYHPIGSWLSSTMESLTSRIKPMAILLIGFHLLSGLAFMLPLALLLRGLRIEGPSGDRHLEGLGVGSIGPVVVGMVVATVLTLVGLLGATHQVYAARIGEPQPLERSLRTGLRRLPRAIGWALVLAVGELLVAAVTLGLAIVLAWAGDGFTPLAILALVLGVVVMAALGVWLGVRLSLTGVAVAVGPAGLNPFRESWRLTSERWWSSLGRFALLMGLAMGVSSVLNTGPAFVGPTGGNVEVQPGGSVFVNGRVFDETHIVFADLLPGTWWFLLMATFSALVAAVQYAILISGAVGLYAQLGGAGET